MSGLFESLNKNQKLLSRLKSLRIRSANQKKQEATDKKYRDVVLGTSSLSEALLYAKQTFSFSLDDSILQKISQVLTGLQNAIAEGNADEDQVIACEKMLKDVKELVRKNWSKFYPQYIGETTNTLRVIQNINQTTVTECLRKIEAAKIWESSLNQLHSLHTGMSDAKNLIDSLELDEKIIVFLQQMNSGQATLSNLNDPVIRWLKMEMLENRIKLTFIG